MDFPYKREFYSDEQIRKSFNKLTKYSHKKRISNENYSCSLPANIFINQPSLIIHYPSDYENYSILSDMFQEKCRMQCSVTEYMSPMDFFQIMDETEKKKDKFQLREYIYSQSKECTSHRPTLLKGFIDMFNAKSILDFSSGWGDRLIGFLASNAEIYYGFDPNKCLYDGYHSIIDFFGKGEKIVKLHEMPFEKVREDVNLMNEMKNKFDMVFTSPPYFKIEKYTNDDSQSISNYKEEETWFKSFLKVALEISIHSLKLGGYLIININQTNKNNYIQKMMEFVESLPNMYYYGVISYSNLNVKKSQPIFIWRKSEKIPNELWNPNLIIKKDIYNKTSFNIVCDNQLPGGTIQRYLVPIFNLPYQTFVFDINNRNLLHCVIYLSKIMKKKIKLIHNSDPKINELMNKTGAEIIDKDKLKSDDFLIDTSEFLPKLIDSLKNKILFKPKRIWLTEYDDTLLNTLHSILIDTELIVVTNIQLNKKNVTVYPEKISSPPFYLQKYISDKIWFYFKDKVETGDYIWNSL